MSIKYLKKIAQNGKHYLLEIVNNKYLIYQYSGVTGNEGEYSDKIAEFKDIEMAMKYWNKII
ncbi:hypothetical protein KKB14_02600 [Patescibacteria group bacterium]|nr:hypothetical protein [Patescibacteria group bacterium]MBU1987416.1 hypothetical protein [Patescibacteria group bacterium]